MYKLSAQEDYCVSDINRHRSALQQKQNQPTGFAEHEPGGSDLTESVLDVCAFQYSTLTLLAHVPRLHGRANVGAVHDLFIVR